MQPTCWAQWSYYRMRKLKSPECNTSATSMASKGQWWKFELLAESLVWYPKLRSLVGLHQVKVLPDIECEWCWMLVITWIFSKTHKTQIQLSPPSLISVWIFYWWVNEAVCWRRPQLNHFHGCFPYPPGTNILFLDLGMPNMIWEIRCLIVKWDY